MPGNDPKDDLQELSAKKGSLVDKTCTWLFHSPEYRRWRAAREFSMLSLHGHPGTGKTMMSMFLVEKLLAEARDPQALRPSRPVYFFCAAQQAHRRTALAVVRGLLYQLCETEICLKHLQAEANRHADPMSVLTNLPALLRVLREILSQDYSFQTVLTIDALDECDIESQNALNRFFHELLQDSVANTIKAKLILACRRTENLDYAKDKRCNAIGLGSDETRNDIALFVRDIMTRKFTAYHLKAICIEVEGEILRKAKSSFLWAQLALEQLINTKTTKEALAKLGVLPAGISELYGTILSELPSDVRDDARWLFSVMIAARRPLTMDELLEAYTLRSSAWSEDKLERPQHQQHIFECCPYLIVLEKTADGTVVDFYHTSVSEYLLQTLAGDPYHIDTCDAHFRMFRICFKSIQPVGDHDHSLANYSCRYMHYHATKAKNLVDSEFPWRTTILTRNQRRCTIWLELIASSNDLFLDRLLTAAVSLDPHFANFRLDNKGRTILALASSCNNIAAVKALLSSVSIVECQGLDLRTPLWWAVRERNVDVVNLLLGAGVTADLAILEEAMEEPPEDSLWEQWSATEHGFLLNANIYIGVPRFYRWPIIPTTYNSGHQRRILQALIQSLLFQDINAQDDQGRTPLMLAARCHEWPAVLALLKRGADADLKDAEQQTALLKALKAPRRIDRFRRLYSSGQHKVFNGAVIIILPSSSTDFNCTSSNETLAFPEAIYTLIDKTTDLEASCPQSGRTALSYAAENGHVGVVQNLLARRAHAQSSDHSGCTPLMWASQLPHFWSLDFERIHVEGQSYVYCGAVMFIMGNNVDFNLAEAGADELASRRHLIIDLLLSSGADINMVTSWGDTAVTLAANDELSDTVAFLRSKGGDDLNNQPSRVNFNQQSFIASNVSMSGESRFWSDPMMPPCYSGFALTGDSKVHFNTGSPSEFAALCPKVTMSDIALSGESRMLLGSSSGRDLGTFGGQQCDRRLVPRSRFSKISISGEGRWGCTIESPEDWTASCRPSLAHFLSMPRCNFRRIHVSEQAQLETANSIVVWTEQGDYAVDTQYPGNKYDSVSVSGDGRWLSRLFAAREMDGLKQEILHFLPDTWSGGKFAKFPSLASEIDVNPKPSRGRASSFGCDGRRRPDMRILKELSPRPTNREQIADPTTAEAKDWDAAFPHPSANHCVGISSAGFHVDYRALFKSDAYKEMVSDFMQGWTHVPPSA